MSTFLFGVGDIYATQTIDASGAAVALPQPLKLGTMQEVNLDISFESKELYGSQQFPVAVGRGKGKISGKAKTASVDGRLLSDLLFGRSAAVGIQSIVPSEARTVPANPGPYTVAIVAPNGGTFGADLGLIYASTGVALNRVAGAPAVGEYAVNAGGTYTFAAADAGAAVLISYSYTKATGGSILTIKNEIMGVAPFFSFDLRTVYQGKELVLHLNRVLANKLGLPLKNDDFVMADLEFSAMADDSGNLGFLQFR